MTGHGVMQPLRVLVLEDRATDAELMVRELRRAGFAPEWRRVQTEAAFIDALDPGLDLILADYRLPQFDGMRALAIVRGRQLDVPFILVTATLGEEIAVDCIKQGAADLVRKDHLERLASAVSRALEDRRLRRENERAHAELRAAHARLEQLARRLQSILESTGEGIYGVDVDGRCTFVNRAAATMFGWPVHELLGQHVHALTHHTKADGSPYAWETCPIRQSRLTGSASRVDGEVFWRRDGTSFPVGYSCYPVVEDGRVEGAVVTFADVTGKQELEAQLRQAQKLEAVGQLTGGVAHDFNNILTAILGFTQFLDESLAPDDPRHSELNEIWSASRRAAHLTRQLLAFSRQQVLDPRVLNLNVLVSDLVQMLRRLVGEHIELRMQTAPDLALTRLDPGQVEQVIVNLIVNARDAMPDGGVVTIETANAVLDRRAVRAYPGAAPGGYVRLRVADTGVGMDDEVRKHVFEPFFTTKPVGKGSGLGLSTVYGIVRQSGGFIHPASEMGKGATFDVFFPMTSGEATVASAARPAVAEGGTETILLVEDDRPIRELSRRVLEKRGYRVLAADGPPAALEAAARETGPIDLLVSDVMMPGGTGPQLYEQLVVERPGLRALFISGYPTELAAESRAAAGAFLQKPFGGEDLSRKVREVLDGAPPAGWHRG